jgi:hypothetical protein
MTSSKGKDKSDFADLVLRIDSHSAPIIVWLLKLWWVLVLK